MSFLTLLGVQSSPPAVPAAGTQVINVTQSQMNFPDTGLTEFSASLNYKAGGNNLLSNLNIDVPSGSGFIINTDNSNTNMAPISLVPVAGTVPLTTIYVKFNPNLVNAYSVSISHSSTGAPVVTVLLTGNGYLRRANDIWTHYHNN